MLAGETPRLLAATNTHPAPYRPGSPHLCSRECFLRVPNAIYATRGNPAHLGAARVDVPARRLRYRAVAFPADAARYRRQPGPFRVSQEPL